MRAGEAICMVISIRRISWIRGKNNSLTVGYSTRTSIAAAALCAGVVGENNNFDVIVDEDVVKSPRGG